MKKISLLFIFFAFFCFIKAQSISDLDKKGGFKGFRIGANKSEYISKMTYVNTMPNGWMLYRASDKSIYSIFNIALDDVRLIFDKHGLLYGINLIKYYDKSNVNHLKTSYNDLDQIAAAFRLQHGNPTGRTDKDTDQYNQVGYLWKADIIYVSVYTQYYGLQNGSELTVEFGSVQQIIGDY